MLIGDIGDENIIKQEQVVLNDPRAEKYKKLHQPLQSERINSHSKCLFSASLTYW